MYRELSTIESIADKLINAGKTDEQVKKIINLYLMEFKNKTNPDGKLDIS